MRSKFIIALIVAAVFLAPVFALADGVATPVFTIGKLRGQLVPESIAYQMTPMALGITPEGDRTPSQPTDVCMGYDNANLYIAVRCYENNMDKLSAKITEHDGRVYAEDSFEIFLDTRHDHKTYFHLITNAAGG